MKRRLLFIVLALLAGCVAYRPIVDTRGVDMNRYHADLGECTQYAAQVDPASNAAAGAAGGAVIGAVIGSLFGSGRDTRNLAIAGAVAGGTGGAAGGARVQQDIIRRCMAGRGYNVLY